MLLILKCCLQSPAVNSLHKDQPPEEYYGILNRVFFTWVVPILVQGYRKILVNEDLPPLSQDMKPKRTREAIIETWSRRGWSGSCDTRPTADKISQARNENNFASGFIQVLEDPIPRSYQSSSVFDFVSLCPAYPHPTIYQIY